jgi:hypothetical protein
VGHRPPVLHHVADPGRHPDVVLEHPEGALLVADQVDARHVHPHPVVRLNAGRLAVEVGAGHHHPPRHDPVGEHLAGAVDVGQERLQRPDPLRDTGLDDLPFGVRDDPRHDVERERALDALERERDALVEEGAGEHVGPDPELGAGQRLERAVQGLVRLAWHPGLAEHLVPARAEPVVLEQVRHGGTLRRTHCPPVTRVCRVRSGAAGTGPADGPCDGPARRERGTRCRRAARPNGTPGDTSLAYPEKLRSC